MITEIIETLQYSEAKEKHDERSLRWIHDFVEALSTGYRLGKLSTEKIGEIYQSLGNDFLSNTVQGHGWRKPLGDAGGFLMIDKIYTRYTSNQPIADL